MATEQTPVIGIMVDKSGYLSTGARHMDRVAKRLIDELVENRFRSEVTAWAASSAGKLPTRASLRLEIARELETLCAALGAWALVPAEEIFPSNPATRDEQEDR